MKKLIALLSVIFIISLSLVSCIDGKRANEEVVRFLSALEEDDYDGAYALLHPDFTISLEEEITTLEEQKDIDFSKGIDVYKFTNVKSAHYDSRVDGSLYETTASISVDGKEGSLTLVVVDNDAGYGIYNFEFEF